MARLRLVSRWFPRRLDIVDAVGRRVATIRHKRSRTDVRVTVKGASYVIEDRAPNVALAHHGRDAARASFSASNDSATTSISVDCSGRHYYLERRSCGLFGAVKYVARERGQIVGTVVNSAVDLPETVPLHIRVFMVWLVANAGRQGVASAIG